ncbi:IS66-like element accessory protein TnpA [Caballeronia sp. DA-9]|uniref:IS66-like element accessory protein TnpA n=1 Tax=Caballeronia sp. DA-9 TaxID=3436237 RepID=UPI003F672547
MQPGVSVAGLALQAGVNVNLLRRWIKLHQQCNGTAAATEVVDDVPTLAAVSALVLVFTIGRREVIEQTGVTDSSLEPMRASSRPPVCPQLTVEMPNGITLRLDCSEQDAPLVSAIIETLRRCDVQARR